MELFVFILGVFVVSLVALSWNAAREEQHDYFKEEHRNDRVDYDGMGNFSRYGKR